MKSNSEYRSEPTNSLKPMTGSWKKQKERGEAGRKAPPGPEKRGIGTLAGGIAHDFNNILGGIIGYTELASIGTPRPRTVKVCEYIRRVLRRQSRAKDLVRQILTFSVGTATMVRGPDASTPIIQENVHLLALTTPNTIEIVFTTTADSDTIVALAGENSSRSTSPTLKANAALAMHKNGGTLEVQPQKP